MENGDDDEVCMTNAGLQLLLPLPPGPPPLNDDDAATDDVPTVTATTNSTAILIAMVRKRQNGTNFATTAAILPPFIFGKTVGTRSLYSKFFSNTKM